ncbi:MAG TPA: peptide ligase PGM1-related protein [Pilimelia sp.]|nr:peptide ligase PGM1-related protein [Pilimelia sp.]
MSTLIVSNQRTEEMVGDLDLLDPDYRRYVGNQAQRMVWCAGPGDILVQPMPATPEFVSYATGLLGLAPDAVDVRTPPPGRYGEGVLSGDRLADDEFVAALAATVRERAVERVLPFHFDSTVATLTRRLSLERVTPGFDFLAQGGGRLLNSKATFRALAAGTGVPVPEGAVLGDRDHAEDYIWRGFLSRGFPVILKQDYHVASFGNEIVSPVPGVAPLGAQRTVLVDERRALATYLADRWSWLTDGGRNRLVVERYLAGSVPIYAELRVEPDGIFLTGHGEMRMKPVLNGLIVPAPSATLPAFPGFLDAARRLCTPLHAMGYRGIVSVDAIVTPERDILINEFNCRVGGSTHVHLIGERLAGADYETNRVLVELRRCAFPPFPQLRDALARSGLAYDPRSRTGVLITVPDDRPYGGSGEYLVVATDAEQARRMELAVAELFQTAGVRAA